MSVLNSAEQLADCFHNCGWCCYHSRKSKYCGSLKENRVVFTLRFVMSWRASEMTRILTVPQGSVRTEHGSKAASIRCPLRECLRWQAPDLSASHIAHRWVLLTLAGSGAKWFYRSIACFIFIIRKLIEDYINQKYNSLWSCLCNESFDLWCILYAGIWICMRFFYQSLCICREGSLISLHSETSSKPGPREAVRICGQE